MNKTGEFHFRVICSKGPLDKRFIFGVFHAEVVPLSNNARKRLYFSEMDTPKS